MRVIGGLVAAAIALGIWQAIVSLTDVPRFILPSPALVGETWLANRALIAEHALVTAYGIRRVQALARVDRRGHRPLLVGEVLVGGHADPLRMRVQRRDAGLDGALDRGVGQQRPIEHQAEDRMGRQRQNVATPSSGLEAVA